MLYIRLGIKHNFCEKIYLKTMTYDSATFPSSCSVILVEPQMGENIGAAARAMLNFGLTDLRLVNPRDGWPNDRAITMGAGAFDSLKVQVFDTLGDAAADLQHLYATTARPRDMVKPVFTPAKAATDTKNRLQARQHVGFVFGPERTGLTNDDIALCHSIVNVPTNPDFSSINLAQSVLLLGYEVFQAFDDHAPQALPYGDSEAVSGEKMEAFLLRLEDALETGRFFKSETLKPTMIRNIRAMFMRADLSDQEVKTLHGIVSALVGQRKPIQ